MYNTKISLFKGNRIRKKLYRNEWWFVINDVIAVLAGSNDPAQYFKKLLKRDIELSSHFKKGGGTICTPPLG